MKKTFALMTCLIALTATGFSQTSVTSSPHDLADAKYVSIRNEIAHAIEKGNDYLKSRQKDGIWGSEAFPAITALAVTSYMRSPEAQGKPVPEYIQKGYEFILASQKEDGSIYNRGLASYNTSVCMMALLAANRADYTPALLKARAYLVRQQEHFAPDSPYYGGIGYGGKDAPPIADLSNTSLALEALHYSRKLASDGKYGKQPDLDWDAAISFVSRCQETSGKDDSEKGGFAYRPAPAETGRPAETQPQNAGARSEGGPAAKGKGPWKGGRGEQGSEPRGAYGSMTYAGIQSLIYSDLKPDDPRVKMAVDWLGNHYTLDENPGVGLQGLYYYYHAMSKAMAALGIDTLNLENGKKVDWRDDLAQKLVSIQKPDGSWVNTNNRWWEADPVLVTSYCILALEQLYYSIPGQKQ